MGNSQLHQTWAWWYVLRPFIGAALALVFYFVVRGGLLTASGGAEDLNPFGIAAVSGMVGMFSKQATDKLRETFDNLFRTAAGTGDAQRADKLTPVNPTISQITPTVLQQGATALTLTITGKNFFPNSLAQVGGSERTTRFISPTSLEADLDPTDVKSAGVLQILVRNPDDVGGAGPAVSLPVT